MNKFFAFFLFTAIFSPLLADVYYPSTIEVEQVGELESKVFVQWFIEVGGDYSSVKELNLTALSFSNYESQQATLIDSNPKAILISDENGEDSRLVFSWSSPNSNFLEANATFFVKTNFQNKKLLKAGSYPFSSVSQEVFLNDSPLIFSTPQMRSQAMTFTNNSNNSLEILGKTSSWVYKNLVYDLAFGDSNNSAPEVFALRRGVCDEYSHLAAAFLRSLGFPSRIAVGYVYSGESWGLHSWLEVFTKENGWISVDPTFNELGILDATHLRLASAVDQSFVKESAQALGSKSLALKISRNINVTVIRSKEFELFAKISANSTQINSTAQKVSATITNPTSEYLFSQVKLSASKEANISGENDELVFFAPNKQKNFEWILFTPEPGEGFVYTYSGRISILGNEQNFSFDKQAQEKLIQRAKEPAPVKFLETKDQKPCFLFFVLAAVPLALLYARKN